jgi:predicted DCC family thiol-disulfide oxidoreductase YuxK
MPGHAARGSPDAAERHLLLYDGECGLCDRVVQIVLARDHRDLFHFASLQSAAAAKQLTRFGGRPERLDTFVVIERYQGPQAKHLTRGRAALSVLKALGWPRAAAVLGWLPGRLLDRLYDFVARHRYRLFGGGDVCFLPRPEDRRRFLDHLDGIEGT